MNIKTVKRYILEELAHGRPIQKILNPQPPMVEVKVRGKVGEGATVKTVPDPDWVKPELPDWNLVVQWLKTDEEFRIHYEHAMKYGAVYLADEMLVLKEQVLADPKSASAYKIAMEMIKTSAMWRDPKYSERTIQEVKNTGPQDADTVLARIQQLKKELGQTVDVQATEVKEKKGPSPRMLAHLEKARAAKEAKKNKE